MLLLMKPRVIRAPTGRAEFPVTQHQVLLPPIQQIIRKHRTTGKKLNVPIFTFLTVPQAQPQCPAPCW